MANDADGAIARTLAQLAEAVAKTNENVATLADKMAKGFAASSDKKEEQDKTNEFALLPGHRRDNEIIAYGTKSGNALYAACCTALPTKFSLDP